MTDEAQRTGVRAWWHRHNERLHSNPVSAMITKVVVTVLGVAVILAGVLLSGPGIPGPGFLVIIAGLAILATEWSWAERLLHWAKAKFDKATERARNMDPAVRRRRILYGALATLVIAGAVAAYVFVYDWPTWSVQGWNWVQDISSVVPELPGM